MEEVLEINDYKSSVKVHLFGATVISWTSDDQDLIFVSRKSLFNGKKAIRGGVPFVFPQFGPWDLGPQHGFARIMKWDIHRLPEKLDDGGIQAVFSLKDNDFSRQLWDHKFLILYSITLKGNQLLFDVSVKNDNTSKEFSFTILLHTYFCTKDITNCTISGLNGLDYIDKVKNGESSSETRDLVTVNEFTDRVYMKSMDKISLTNVGEGSTICIEKENLSDTVLWNPWEDNAKSMVDFGDDEYTRMICVEAGRVSEAVVLEAGDIFKCSQILTLM